ncbi:hypothetical protein CO015_01240 [candidate division WWE3 bacterium CG_4_8_14_3_um_filter_42_11]|uniref:Uncharacterized protein n=3 Tax=Bacteria candidate phyla TaxID=1783234 RepID=A0A2M7WXN7_UNCKA|nr:MAG: hypothetical protein COX22_03275 [Candidatus Falkowbacteria bacterium CG23_combo_of_CG06-09_8_20_14_all_49_15]PJA37812.1 MAG: hypothetical protein CO181_02010 [candidate division WWE3 bacterium CG_4_9_14_3_um_filter_43_9]PJC69191.1 MAG: hypothetical protein CO015_01240 [candidate division WWE3 bacterium CG_4_8_14_3_um_filter_42_11]
MKTRLYVLRSVYLFLFLLTLGMLNSSLTHGKENAIVINAKTTEAVNLNNADNKYGPLPLNPDEYKNFEQRKNPFFDSVAKYLPYVTLFLSIIILVVSVIKKFHQPKSRGSDREKTSYLEQIDWETKVKYD